ncbi:hypothetical protein [Actinopolymorpha pittospori]
MHSSHPRPAARSGLASRPRLAVVLAAALLLVLSPLTTGSAPAAPPPPAPPMSKMSTTTLLLSSIPATGGRAVPFLRLPTRHMKAGQSIYVVGRMAAVTNVPRGPMMGIRIICLGGSGGPFTVRNHDGRAYGVQAIVVRWLFTAPHDGNYTCELRGVGATQIDPQVARLDLVASRSLLQATPVRPGAQGWMTGADTCVGTQGIPNIPQCAQPRSAVTVLARHLSAGTARFVNTVTDVQLSREYGAYPGGSSTVKVTLHATPSTASGHPCAPVRSTSRTATINGHVHHYKVNLTLPGTRVNLGGGCGRQVLLQTRVEHLAGNPVTVHDSRYSNAAAWTY